MPKPQFPSLITIAQGGSPQIAIRPSDPGQECETIVRCSDKDYVTLGRIIFLELTNFRALGYIAHMITAEESGIVSHTGEMAVTVMFLIRPPHSRAEGSAAMAEAMFINGLRAQQKAAQEIAPPKPAIILPG